MAPASTFDAELVACIPKLRRYARALTRNPTQADDLVQDTLTRAVAKQQQWQSGTDLRAWLFTIMHNNYATDVKRSVRRGTTVGDEVLLDLHPATDDPQTSLIVRDLLRALVALPADQRRLVLMVGVDGVPYEEVAEREQIPIGTVRSRLWRGRQALRQGMGWDD